MANNRDTRRDNDVSRDPLSNNLEGRSTVPNDLPDSPEDRKKLEQEETTVSIPDVKDIPGQEFVNAPPMGEMADTTVSSADEEGAGIFGDEQEFERGGAGSVSRDERQALERIDYMPTTDEDNLQRASLDSTDFQGDTLNEKGFGETRGDTVAPDDLDTNITDDESTYNSPSDEDEENDSYSLGSADNDNVTEGTP
jgi:hypothetical protein